MAQGMGERGGSLQEKAWPTGPHISPIRMNGEGTLLQGPQKPVDLETCRPSTDEGGDQQAGREISDLGPGKMSGSEWWSLYDVKGGRPRSAVFEETGKEAQKSKGQPTQWTKKGEGLGTDREKDRSATRD